MNVPIKNILPLAARAGVDGQKSDSHEAVEQFLDKHQRSIVQNLAFFIGVMALLFTGMRLAAVGTIDPQGFPITVIIVGCLFTISYRLFHGENIRYAGEIVMAITTVWIFYFCILSGGLVGPVFPLIAILPLAAMIITRRKTAIGMMILLSCYILLIFFLSTQSAFFSSLAIEPKQLFLMRALIMIFAVGIVGTLGWYFSSVNSKLVAMVVSQANTDYLTGILNRRAVEQIYRDEFSRAVRNKEWISVIMVDIDHFKACNDTHGHQVGDRCLKNVASILSRAAQRPGDAVGRYGGEEFFIVLPGTDPAGAREVAERLRHAVESLSVFLEDGQILKLTISLGVYSSIPTRDDNPERLMHEADALLYKSKENGRNQASFSTSRAQDRASGKPVSNSRGREKGKLSIVT